MVYCPLTGYKSAIMTGNFPIADLGSVTVGPLPTPPDGSFISDVIVDLQIQHTWVGDLIASVSWDDDCNPATPSIGPVNVLCRQLLVGCATSGCCGCSGDLICANTYEFSDAAVAELGDPSCTTTLAGGCYKPALDSPNPLSVFDGRLKRGCWYLTVTDNAGGDSGTICAWSIHILNQLTATEHTSWGSVKALYQ